MEKYFTVSAFRRESRPFVLWSFSFKFISRLNKKDNTIVYRNIYIYLNFVLHSVIMIVPVR